MAFYQCGATKLAVNWFSQRADGIFYQCIRAHCAFNSAGQPGLATGFLSEQMAVLSVYQIGMNSDVNSLRPHCASDSAGSPVVNW